MAIAFFDFDLGTQFDEILKCNNYEFYKLIDSAVTDMVADTFSTYKSPADKRKVAIELEISRIDRQISIGIKVQPKAAPYIQIPDNKSNVPPGQTSIEDYIVADTGEIIK